MNKSLLYSTNRGALKTVVNALQSMIFFLLFLIANQLYMFTLRELHRFAALKSQFLYGGSSSLIESNDSKEAFSVADWNSI